MNDNCLHGECEEDEDLVSLRLEDPKAFAELQARVNAEITASEQAANSPRPSPWQRAKACLLSLFA